MIQGIAGGAEPQHNTAGRLRADDVALFPNRCLEQVPAFQTVKVHFRIVNNPRMTASINSPTQARPHAG